MAIVMILRGTASGARLPHDGQFLKSFDFEAHGGQGEITMTEDLNEAMRFATMEEAFAFYKTQPKCQPIRPHDGRPNRPLTSTNWEFQNVD